MTVTDEEALAASPGDIGFSILSRVAGERRDCHGRGSSGCVAFAFTELKLVVEPGGAVALAALLAGKLPFKDKTVGIVLTGGNIDPQMLKTALSR